jgi:hypothetical protein
MWAEMDSWLQSGADRKRAIFCLLVIAFLLYNPFFTVLSSSFELSLTHPLSYRATVAGSELRRCTLDTEKLLIPALMAVAFLLAGMALSHEVDLIQPSDSVVPAVTSASDGIWFRPPPTA